MSTSSRSFPPGDLRASDSDRDRALAALTAICFGGVAVINALRPGVGGSAVLPPAVMAVLCVVLVIVLQIRARAN